MGTLKYGKVYEKRDLACIIKKYNKNALRLICYNFRTVNAINFLFSTLHTAPFLYGEIHFGALHLLCVSIAIDIRLEGIGNRARAPYISIERSGDTPGSC